MKKKYTGAELVIESLISENVKIIFGYPKCILGNPANVFWGPKMNLRVQKNDF